MGLDAAQESTPESSYNVVGTNLTDSLADHGVIASDRPCLVMNAPQHRYPVNPRREVLRLEALALLKEFAGDLVGIEDPESLLWAVAERTISKLGWLDCVIYLCDPYRDVLIQKAAFGPKSLDYKAIFQPIEVPIGKGIVGKVASTGKAISVGDTRTFSGYIQDDDVRLSELAVPILWGNEVLGVIDSEHPEANFYVLEDQLILETIAGITATKIQNARSAKANEELALFYERNPNPVLQLGVDHKISFINEAAQRCFPEHLKRGSILERKGLDEALEQAQSKGQVQWRCSQENPDTGEWRTGEFNIVHLPSGQFNLYGSDISHILKLQKAAEAANEAKSRFLSVMSHEIRTPLNAILGLTDLLIHEDPTREEQLRHLAYMEFSGRHLLSLVNDILDLEKMASGKATSVPSLFNLPELLANIIDSFQNRADKVGLALSLEVEASVPEVVLTDVKWVTQILNNLIGNAIKYTEKGSVLLQVCSLGEEQDGTHPVRFSVIDTGRGIPETERDRILQPFEQIRDTADIEGTGLGLAIVHKIVQRMDGDMQIESVVDQGSTFHVDLPLIQSETDTAKTKTGEIDFSSALNASTPASRTESETEKKGGTSPIDGCRILIADDNELNRFVASKLLIRWGYEVTEAVNGKEAIEAWENEGACLILMDVQMPVMDGIEATVWIRNQERARGLTRSPILALTADAEEQTYQRIIAADMDDRIVKPFDPTALRTLIERMASKMSASL